MGKDSQEGQGVEWLVPGGKPVPGKKRGNVDLELTLRRIWRGGIAGRVARKGGAVLVSKPEIKTGHKKRNGWGLLLKSETKGQ